jgi:hypothetical protein
MARSQCRPAALASDVGTHAGRHHHQVGGNPSPSEAHRLHAALALDFGGLAAQQDAQAAPFQRGAQQLGGGRVELLVHQAGRHVHHRDFHALAQQAVGGLQAQQAAADDDRVPARARRASMVSTSCSVAEADHARQFVARHRHDEGWNRWRSAGGRKARPGRNAACTSGACGRCARPGRRRAATMPFWPYHSRVCSMMSSTVFSPASTGDSRMRL